jgi:putative transposase
MLPGDIAEAIRELLNEVAAEKKIDLIEHEAIVDHVHLLLRATDKTALSRAMNDLKGVSARRVFQRFPDVKLDAHTR